MIAQEHSLVALAEAHGAKLDEERRGRLADLEGLGGDGAVEALLACPGVNEESLLRALAAQLEIPWWPEAVLNVARDAMTKVPAALAVRHQVVPLGLEGRTLVLGIYNLYDMQARQQLGRTLTEPFRLVASTRTRIHDAIQQGYGIGAETLDAILAGRAQEDVFDQFKEESSQLDDSGNDEASVITFVNRIFREAIAEGATDIHVEPLEDGLRIRFRRDGMLHEIPVPANIKALQESVIARLKIMARLDIAERRLPQDGRINLEAAGLHIDVRVATIPTVTGETVSLRLLSGSKYSLDSIGAGESEQKVLQELISVPNGIILVTGPTGSGKSTTLYTLLSCLNQPGRRIVTIEDPVENKIAGINQIAVRSEIGLTFAVGLRSILRADPNIVMVGEMRDAETAETAIRAALTGHLVFSTLHTNDAVSSIGRLTDMGIEPFLVAASVRAFIAQRLVRRLCPECRVPVDYSDVQMRSLGMDPGTKHHFFKAAGCPACRNSGYAGRLAIMEICRMTPALQELVANRATNADLQRQALEDGMKPLRLDGLFKAMDGRTSLEEIQRVTATDKPAAAPSK